ncbi:hypothetical protein [Ensifer sp. ENS01]|uniref:hypothetical protein n=1 Tax=Ensifer sp. ENS01 TaxID=2769293 RepID=UPI001784DA13|nr:hypothetical protein [Ensifer sp. ENS01]MBD9498612.1 hypothetical protein [Ensifer sp. ENS01]
MTSAAYKNVSRSRPRILPRPIHGLIMEEWDKARKQGTFNIYKFYSITFQLHRLPSIILDVRHGTKLGAECFLRRGQKRKSVSLPAAEASKICVVGAHEIGSLAPKDTGA